MRSQQIKTSGKQLLLIQEARYRWFRSLNFKDEKSIEEDIGIIVADASLQYQAEMFYGDEIKIELSVSDLSHVNFDLFYRLSRLTDHKVCCIAKTGIGISAQRGSDGGWYRR